MADTRQEILDTALELFADQGYDKTSLREIAERVGVTKAALYYHFRSKEQILLALFEPIAVMQQAVVDDLQGDRMLDPATWIPTLERVMDAVLDNRRLFNLLERNGQTLMDLKEGSFADTHREMHERTETFFADTRIPLQQRVRLACAFGSIFAAIEVGGSIVFDSNEARELKPMLMEAIHALLDPVVEPARR